MERTPRSGPNIRAGECTRRQVVALRLAVVLFAVLASAVPAIGDPEPRGIPVRGRVIVEGTTEVVRSVAFTLRHEKASWSPIEVEGGDGRFEFRAPWPGDYYVADLEVDGTPYPWGVPPLRVSAVAEVELVVQPATRAVLEVRAAETGRHVPNAWAYPTRHREPGETLPSGMVAIQRGPDWIPGREAFEGPPLRSNSAGGIDLPPARGAVGWFVVADGRAWTYVLAPQGPSGPVPVGLPLGGSVALRIERWSELFHPNVKIRGPAGDDVVLPNPTPDGSLRLAGIPPGEHVVTVSRGLTDLPYVTARIQVAAGREAAATLVPTRIGSEVGGTLAGTLTLPAAWDAERVSLMFAGVDDSTRGFATGTRLQELLPGAAVRFTSSARLPLGRYRATVWPFQYAQDCELTADHPVEIVVPDPVEIRVRVLDDRTGAPVSHAAVTWTRSEPALLGHVVTFASFNPDHGAHRFFLGSADDIAVSVECPGARTESFELDLARATRTSSRAAGAAGPIVVEREVRVRQRGAVAVRLRLDGEPYRPPSPGRLLLARVGPGPGTEGDVEQAQRRSIEDGGAWVTDLEPGRYVLRVEPLPPDDRAPRGFAIPIRAVLVTPGEVTDVPIDLERIR